MSKTAKKMRDIGLVDVVGRGPEKHYLIKQ